MKYIFIIAIVVVLIFSIFEYFTVKSAVDTADKNNAKYLQEQQQQVETQTNKYTQQINDIKQKTNDAYKDIGQ